MPSELKNEKSAVTYERVYDPKPFGLNHMVRLTLLAMFFGLLSITAGVLFIVFRQDLKDGVNGFAGISSIESDKWTAPIIAATALLGASFVGGAFTGCLLLGLRWAPYLQQERGYVIAFAIVVVLVGFLFVSTIMGLILLMKLSRYKKVDSSTQAPPLSWANKAQV